MRDYFATHLPRIWQDRTHPVSKLLYPLSLIYNLVITARRWLYGMKILKSESVAVPLIIVGNVTVGGTGKTPLVIWFTKFLQKKNLAVGIISRGYGGSSPQWPVDVSPLEKAELVGDEAVLLRQKVDAPVIVSPNRLEAAQLLIEKYNVDVIVSDDGLQHLALERDLEIIVIDAKRQFGNGRLLPSGPLRQTPGSINPDAIQIFSGDTNPDEFEFSMKFEPVTFRNVNSSNQSLEINYFKNQQVNTIAGIGDPEKFFQTLRSLDIDLNSRSFPDHHVFQKTNLDFSDDKPILMTEKDAVKCKEFNIANAWYLEIEAVPNQEFINKLEQSITELIT